MASSATTVPRTAVVAVGQPSGDRGREGAGGAGKSENGNTALGETEFMRQQQWCWRSKTG